MAAGLLAALLPRPAGGDPAAVGGAGRPIVGATRWDGWNAWDVWQRSFDAKKWQYRLPFYGTISPDGKAVVRGDSQEVMDREIAYAKSGGLDYWVFQWYNPELRFPDTYVAPLPADAMASMDRAFDLYLTSKHKSDMHYALSMSGLSILPLDGLSKALDYFVERFKDPSYQKVMGGRPLVYCLDGDNFITFLGSKEAAHGMIADLRRKSVAAGAGDPYVVIQAFAPTHGAQLLDELGCDAISAYCSYTHREMVHARPTELPITVWVADVKVGELTPVAETTQPGVTVLRRWQFGGREGTPAGTDGVALWSDAGSGKASMVADPDFVFPGGKGALKVAFTAPAEFQLYFGAGQKGLALTKGRQYVVSLQLRMSRKTPLPVSARIITEAAPYAPLGTGAEARAVAVGTKWQEFRFEFTPDRDFDESTPLRVPDLFFTVTKGPYYRDHSAENREFPYALLAAANREFWRDCQATGKQVIPIVNAGWDYRPMKQPQYKWLMMSRTMDSSWYTEATPRELAQNVKTAMDWVDANPSTCPSRAVLIYAWNELSEGGWLVPTLKQGTAKLDALASLLGPDRASREGPDARGR